MNHSRHAAGDGVLEMRLDYRPGYRVYYVRRGVLVIVFLCGGDPAHVAHALGVVARARNVD